MVQKKIYSYFERNPQLHVLFIFDQMNVILNDIEDKQWDDSFIFKVFDGAWFNTKYDIENTWKDKRVVLLFPEEVFPHTEEQMLKFPLLDMLKANMEYKEDDYESFMQQYNLPDKFRLFVKNNIGEIMSARISSILAGMFTPETFSEDIVCRAFISAYLGEKKLLDWEPIIIRMIVLDLPKEEKRRIDFYHRLEKNRDAKKAVDNKLTRIFGRSYSPNSEAKMKKVVECLKYNSITQLLDAAPLDNYKQYKVTSPMMIEAQNRIYEYGLQSRQWGERFSKAMAELGRDIREEEIIKVYGIDAQFHYITEGMCWPMLSKMMKERLMADPAEVNDKIRILTIKFPMEADIQIVFRFISQVALFYDKVRSVTTMKLNTADAYVSLYTETWHLVDRFYRHSLEAYHQLITKDYPIIEILNDVKRQLDQEYAKLTNILNLEWMACVEEKPELFNVLDIGKQEEFFVNESEPSTKQVIIISDAFRYEVAEELMEELAKEKHVATIVPYRAMLPTETKYTKTALLPHHSLQLQGTDMAVDGQVLVDMKQRTAHLNRHREGAICVTFEEVMNGDQNTNRELFKRPLVYIFHDIIDETSHGQDTFEIIRSCRTAIDQLKVLITRLHATWNVSNVVVTADHGFIYNDIHFEEKDKHSVDDSCIEKKTRYYLTTSNTQKDGIEKFPLQLVSAMKSDSSVYVAVPTGTNRLAASGGYQFAHGGATLQEMIIPVIKSSLRRTDKTEQVGVALMSHNLNMVNSRLKFHLIQSEAVTMNVTERKVACCIYDGDRPVTDEREVLLNSTDASNLNNRVFEMVLHLSDSSASSVLQLRVWDVKDRLNPLIRETVKNNTMIEQDF